MMFKKVYTSKKAGGVNVRDKEDASVCNFEMELEEEKSCNTFNSGSNNYVFDSLFSKRSTLPVTTASRSSEWQAQISTFGRPQNENQQVSTSGRNLKQEKSVQKDSESKGNVISITASRVRLGEHYGEVTVVSFNLKRIEVKILKGSEKVLSKEWPLEELCSFKSYYNFHFDNAEEEAIVILRFHRRRVFGRCSKDVCNIDDDLTDSFVMEVDNEEWVEQQRRILAMSEKYQTVWTRLDRAKVVDVKERLSRSPLKELRSNVHLLRPSQELQIFETLIFPEGDPDAVTITRNDIEVLRPMGFLNDTIIDFYIKYLQINLSTKDKERFYFFNSFFFRKLVDSSKICTDNGQGKVAYERVRKWTREVNLFEKDYIFIPVNQSLHWSLIIICHLGSIGCSPDEGKGTPCILHLDSLEGSHAGIEEHIRNYILQAWIEKDQLPKCDIPEALSHMRYIEAKVPQQNNHCDCGTYLLHYVELFLKSVPLHFSLAPPQGFPYFNSEDAMGVQVRMFKPALTRNYELTRGWFKSSEASAKRRIIHNLVIQVHEASLSSATDRPTMPPTELQAIEEDDVCISSDSKLIHSNLVESLQGQICDQLEGTSKQLECPETSSVETPPVMDLCDSDPYNEVPLRKDNWRSDHDEKLCPSFSTCPESYITPLRVEEFPLVSEISTLFSETDSTGYPPSLDTESSLDEQDKLYPAVGIDDDEESCRKRRKLMTTVSDLEEDLAHLLCGVPEGQRQSDTESDMVPPPAPDEPQVCKLSGYFADIQNYEIILLDDDWES